LSVIGGPSLRGSIQRNNGSTDEMELRKGDHSGAIAVLRESANARDPVLRAAALSRIAGIYLQSGQFQESLRIYQQLSDL
jgi:hypothetical protein